MRMTAFLLAASAYTLLAVGLVLMKKGIGWFGRGAPRDAAWRRDLGVWAVGFLLSNAYIVPVTLALRDLPPHIVGAFAGLGVIVMVLLSRAWLGEKLRRSDAVYAGGMGLAIGLLSLSATAGAGGAGNSFRLTVAAVFPFLLLAGAFFGRVGRRRLAILLAAVSGTCRGDDRRADAGPWSMSSGPASAIISARRTSISISSSLCSRSFPCSSPTSSTPS